jgi:hypothetical protein
MNPQQPTCPAIPVQDAKTTQEFLKAQQAMQHEQIQFQSQQALYSYRESLARELGSPVAFVTIMLLLVIAASYLIRRAIDSALLAEKDSNQAATYQNESDNKADIEIARIGGRRPEKSNWDEGASGVAENSR